MIEPLSAIATSSLVLGALKKFFENEIGYWSHAIEFYLRRPFDENRDPDDPDWCQIRDPASGEWKTVEIYDYCLDLNSNTNGVYIRHRITGEDGVTRWAEERLPFNKWAGLRKRHLPSRRGNAGQAPRVI